MASIAGLLDDLGLYSCNDWPKQPALCPNTIGPRRPQSARGLGAGRTLPRPDSAKSTAASTRPASAGRTCSRPNSAKSTWDSSTRPTSAGRPCSRPDSAKSVARPASAYSTRPDRIGTIAPSFKTNPENCSSMVARVPFSTDLIELELFGGGIEHEGNDNVNFDSEDLPLENSAEEVDIDDLPDGSVPCRGRSVRFSKQRESRPSFISPLENGPFNLADGRQRGHGPPSTPSSTLRASRGARESTSPRTSRGKNRLSGSSELSRKNSSKASARIGVMKVPSSRKPMGRGDKEKAEAAPTHQRWQWYRAWKCKTLGLPIFDEPETAKAEEQAQGESRSFHPEDLDAKSSEDEGGGDGTRKDNRSTWFNGNPESDGNSNEKSRSKKEKKEMQAALFRGGGFGNTGNMSLPEWLASGGDNSGQKPAEEIKAQKAAVSEHHEDGEVADSAKNQAETSENSDAEEENEATLTEVTQVLHLLWPDEVIQSTLSAHKVTVRDTDTQHLETLTKELRSGEAYLATGEDGALTHMIDAVELRISNSVGHVLVERPVAGSDPKASNRKDHPWQGNGDWDIGRLLCSQSQKDEETWDAAVRALTDRRLNVDHMRVVKPPSTQWRRIPSKQFLPSACRVVVVDMTIVADEETVCQRRGAVDGWVLGWENPATSPAFRSESGIRLGRMRRVIPYTEEHIMKLMKNSGANLPPAIWNLSPQGATVIRPPPRGSGAVQQRRTVKGIGLLGALTHELSSGKSSLMERADGVLVRQVDIVCARIRGDGDLRNRVLVEITEVEPETAQLPQARREPGAPDVWSAALRIVRGLDVQMQGHGIELHLSPKVKWQEAENEEFPGLPTVLRMIYVDGTLVANEQSKDSKQSASRRLTAKQPASNTVVEKGLTPQRVGTFQQWQKRKAEQEQAENNHREYLAELEKARVVAAKDRPGMSVSLQLDRRESLTAGLRHIGEMDNKDKMPTFESSPDDLELLMFAKKYSLTVVDVDRLKRRFDSVANIKGASSGLGYVDQEEFVSLMQDLLNIRDQYDFSLNRLKEFWRIVDLDNSGAIDFEEFLCFSLRYFGADLCGKGKKGSSCVSAVDTVPVRSWDHKRLREFELFDVYQNGDLEMHASRKKSMAQSNSAQKFSSNR